VKLLFSLIYLNSQSLISALNMFSELQCDTLQQSSNLSLIYLKQISRRPTQRRIFPSQSSILITFYHVWMSHSMTQQKISNSVWLKNISQ